MKLTYQVLTLPIFRILSHEQNVFVNPKNKGNSKFFNPLCLVVLMNVSYVHLLNLVLLLGHLEYIQANEII